MGWRIELGVVEARDVDPSDPWPDGRDRAEDEALSDRPDRRGMGADRAVAAQVPARAGRRREIDLREVLNAIRYMARTGGGWRMLPKDFPPWQTVYWWFRRFVRLLLFRTIHDVALMLDRERVGPRSQPDGRRPRQPDRSRRRTAERARLRRRQEDRSGASATSPSTPTGDC